MVDKGRVRLCKVLESFLRIFSRWSVYQVGTVRTFGRARKYLGSGCLSMQSLKE